MTQHHANQPPVAANKKVDSASQSCPLKAKRHCEVKQLVVKSKYVYTNDATQSPVVTELKTKRRRRGEKIPPASQAKLGAAVVDLLSRYDLVIEALAGFPNKGNEEAPEKAEHGRPRPTGAVAMETKGVDNVAEIEVEAEFEEHCPYDAHLLLRMQPGNDSPSNPCEVHPPPVGGEEHMKIRSAAWKPGTKKIELKDVTAPTFKNDLAGGDSAFAGLWRLVMWVCHANKALDVEFIADSCGTRSPTERGTQNLNALVRVYRDLNVAVGLSVPPAKRRTQSYDKRWGLTDTSVATKKEVVGHGHQTTVTTERNKSGFKGCAVFGEAEGGFELYFKFNELEFKLKETADKAKEQAEGLNEARKNAVEKYKHIRDEHKRKKAIDKAVKEAFGDFLSFRDKIELFFQDFVSKVKAIEHAIVNVLELMKKWPQLGFKLTFEIAFLSGQFFVGWGHATVDSSQPLLTPLKDRYAPLLHKLHVESKISIVTFKVEASFGLLIDGGSVGRAEARVAGSLNMELMWQTMLDLIIGAGWSNGKDADMLTQQLTATTTGNLRATLEVKVAWLSWKKEIGIESGLAIDGRVEWKLMKGEVKYSVNLRSLETGWYIYSTDLKTGEGHCSLHKIFDAKLLWHAESNLRLTG
jgi:hypothetical protein